MDTLEEIQKLCLKLEQSKFKNTLVGWRPWTLQLILGLENNFNICRVRVKLFSKHFFNVF
jgi:hypothetical protein